MFSSKKEKQENKKSSVSVTQTQHVSPNQLTVQSTFQQRSQSVSYSYEVKQGFPSGSITSLQGLPSNLKELPSGSDLKKAWSASNVPQLKLDARPIVPSALPSSGINMNYQSPYRNSASSYRGGQTSRPGPITATTSSTVLPKTFAPVKAKPIEKLVVKKTGKFYDNDNSEIPTYKTSSKNRGEALIINNIMFEGEDERKGAKIDHERLEDLFKQIGFKVTLKKNLKGKTMKEQIEIFSKKGSLKTADISVVVIMSHGAKSDLRGGTEVYGVDHVGVLVEDILQNFSKDKCKNMVGKPKIFIFQCCRGENEQAIQSDAKPIKPRPLDDMLIAYSTLPGFVSYRDPVMGTWYIQTICDVFSQHAHENHVEDLLKIVDMELSTLSNDKVQTSSYESRGFKRCYLHPK